MASATLTWRQLTCLCRFRFLVTLGQKPAPDLVGHRGRLLDQPLGHAAWPETKSDSLLWHSFKLVCLWQAEIRGSNPFIGNFYWPFQALFCFFVLFNQPTLNQNGDLSGIGRWSCSSLNYPHCPLSTYGSFVACNTNGPWFKSIHWQFLWHALIAHFRPYFGLLSFFTNKIVSGFRKWSCSPLPLPRPRKYIYLLYWRDEKNKSSGMST